MAQIYSNEIILLKIFLFSLPHPRFILLFLKSSLLLFLILLLLWWWMFVLFLPRLLESLIVEALAYKSISNNKFKNTITYVKDYDACILVS